MTHPTFQLHHIGLLVKSIEIATELQVTRYGYQIASDIIHDPIQTAHVRFLRLPNGLNWLELVSPDDGNSKLSNALTKRGEGLHHICYEVTGIESAGEHLRQGRQMQLSGPTSAVAFGGRRIAWFMDRSGHLTELLEAGEGPFSLGSLSPIPLQEL
jgi:methylmalonyl-CoA/ethylmalonyl-CoA epimerase